MKIVEVFICGVPPKDPPLNSVDGKCPYCESVNLEPGFGLAAGGYGSYNYCPDCHKFCDFVEDEE